MLKRLALLLSPDAAVAGGGTAVAPDPDQGGLNDLPPGGGLEDFMKGVLEMAGQTTQPNKPDGNTAAKLPGNDGTAGTGNSGQPAPAPADKAGESGAVVDKAKPESDTKADPAKPATETATKLADTAEKDAKWPRNAKEWDNFKATEKEKRDNLQKQVQEREAKIESLSSRVQELETKGIPDEAAPQSKAEIERLNKLVEEMSNRIRIRDLNDEPRFENWVKEQITEQMSVAKGILGEERGAKFEKLLSIPDHEMTREWKQEQMQEFLSDLTPLEMSDMSIVRGELAKVERAKQRELAKNQEHVKTLKDQSAAKQQEIRAEREKLFNDTVGTMGDDKIGIAIYQKKEGNDEWNKGVDSRIATAKSILFGSKDLKPQDIAKAALHAAAYPFLLQGYAADRQESAAKIAKLEAQVKNMTAAQPGNRGTSADATANGDAVRTTRQPHAGQTPQEAMADWMKNTITPLE